VARAVRPAEPRVISAFLFAAWARNLQPSGPAD